MTWEGRRLISTTKNGASIQYSYDDSGLRLSKQDSNGITRYTYDNGRIVHQYTENNNVISNELFFRYDENGAPLSISYNSTEYFYVLNLQGDIIGIIDNTGALVVQYTYDSWGKHSLDNISGSMAATLGVVNPLRYRGYYYDTDTGFYLTGTRYYNPEIGRFINVDSVIAGVGGSIQGNNMFTYCFNNPINMSDPAGNWPEWIKNSFKWMADKIYNSIVKPIQQTLSKVDFTSTTGINVSGTPGAIIFNAQIGISVDTKGNVAVQGSVGLGMTSGTSSVSATVYQSVTNAPSIDKLEGPSRQYGGSVSGIPVYEVPILAVTGDFNIIPDSYLNTTYYGGTIGAGIGTPGVEGHFEACDTITLPGTKFNVFDLAEDIYIKIMEW